MNDYRKRPQDYLPYEQRMKNIIRGYRNLWDKLEMLVPYTKELEEKVSMLQLKLYKARLKNEEINRNLIDKRRENKRLKAHIEWLHEKFEQEKKELTDYNNDK